MIESINQITYAVLTRKTPVSPLTPKDIKTKFPNQQTPPLPDGIVIWQKNDGKWWWRFELPSGAVKDQSKYGYDTYNGAVSGQYGLHAKLTRKEFEELDTHWRKAK